MVWAGVIMATAIPNDLRGAPDSLLVYRRIIKDLDDDDAIIADDFAILLSNDYLARTLSREAHTLEVALFYCEHPQRLGCISMWPLLHLVTM
jgi:DNA modification methylase